MHVTLFKALKSVNLTDDQATEVVKTVEEYIAVKITEANKNLEARIQALTYAIAAVGGLIALSPIIEKFIN